MRLALGALIAISILLRIILVLHGGQFYWPDEVRFRRSAEVISRLERIGPRAGLRGFLQGRPAHLGFVVLGIVPTALDQAVVGAGMDALPESQVASLILSTASVACILLVYGIALRYGASRTQSLAAAFLMATCTSMLYFARHLLPYDLSMALLLAGLWTGSRQAGVGWSSIVGGLLAGLGFLTYYGYWTLAALVLILHVYFGASPAERVKRLILFGIGFAALPLALQGIGVAVSDRSLLPRLLRFSGTIRQGDFAEGWLVPFEYLWASEGFVVLLWGIAVAVGLALAVRRRYPSRAALLWLAAALVVYLALAIGSTGTGRFVVYGRSVRQVVPFLCLAAGWGLGYLWESSQRRAATLFGASVIVFAALNMAAPLTQSFPREIIEWTGRHYPGVQRALTVQTRKSPQPSSLQPGYVLLNAQHIYPILGSLPAPRGRELFRIPHPLEYAPYQYEGFSAVERGRLHGTDISIRLVDSRAP